MKGKYAGNCTTSSPTSTGTIAHAPRSSCYARFESGPCAPQAFSCTAPQSIRGQGQGKYSLVLRILGSCPGVQGYQDSCPAGNEQASAKLTVTTHLPQTESPSSRMREAESASPVSTTSAAACRAFSRRSPSATVFLVWPSIYTRSTQIHR